MGRDDEKLLPPTVRFGRVGGVTSSPPADDAALLHAYDSQLRQEAEVPSALSVQHLGPLVLATYVGGRGFISYRDLSDEGRPATEESVTRLVDGALEHYAADPAISRVE